MQCQEGENLIFADPNASAEPTSLLALRTSSSPSLPSTGHMCGLVWVWWTAVLWGGLGLLVMWEGDSYAG